MQAIQVQSPPAKPLMVFDGECDFCRFWIERWRNATGDTVEYLPFQSRRVAAQFPELPRERLEQSVHFIEPDGTAYSGAEAVFRSLASNPQRRRWLRMYEKARWFARLAEWCYRFVAGHRTTFSKLTRLFF